MRRNSKARIFSICTSVLFILYSGGLSCKEFSLDKNHFSFGGAIESPISIYWGSPAWNINLEPHFSYFIDDKWEIGGKAIFEAILASPVPVEDRVTWGIGVLFRKYFAFHERLFFYGGAGLDSMINDFKFNRMFNRVLVEGGMLFPIGKIVALDFGIPVHINFANFKYQSIHAPIGFVGFKIVI